MYHFLSAAPSLDQTSTHTFSAAVSAVLVILALCGIAYIVSQPSQVRNVALLLIVGIIIVDSSWGQAAGNAVRDVIVSLGNAIHLPQVVSGTIFTVLILLSLVLVGSQLKKQRKNGTATLGWYVAFFLLLLVFFTFSWAQNLIVGLSQWAVKFLDVLSKF